MRIIAISGKATSGKSTVTKIIKQHYADVYICPFAEDLKLKAAMEFNVPMDDILNNKNKIITIGGKDMTIRQLLIKIGSMYRELDPLYWVNRSLDKIIEIEAKHPSNRWKKNLFIIDDLRFKNEAEKLRSIGAKLIRIERPGINLIDDPSEKDLDDYRFDQVFVNDKDMAHLVQFARGDLFRYDNQVKGIYGK
jgi:tRNA uridine 5-carbamoylmethylation protein Kti12